MTDSAGEIERLTRELGDARQQQSATAEVLKVISRSAFDLQKVLDTLAQSAARLCAADIAIIHRFTQGEFQVASSHGAAVDALPWLSSLRQQPGRGSVSSRVLLEHATVHVPDFEADPDYTFVEGPRKLGIRAILGVPLLREGALIGLLLLQRKIPRPFAPKQIELAETFADQAVIAIENVRLFDEVQSRNRELSESLERQTATSAILRAIAASPTDIQPVLDAVAESAARLCDAYDVVIALRDPDGVSLQAAAHFGPIPLPIFKYPIRRDWPAGRAFVDRLPVHVPDFTLAGVEFPFGQEMALRAGFRSALAAPLLREGAAIGIIGIRRTEVRAFSQKQIDLLTTFADQAVIAIENVRLFEEVQSRNRDLSEALEQQTATGAILRAIASSPTDIQPVLDAVAESAARLCDAYDSAILLRDGDQLAWRAHFGPIPIDFVSWPINRDWVTGRAFVDAKPVHVDDLSKADEFPAGQQMALRLGHRTMLAVPLLREAEPIGALIVRRREVRPFSGKQIELLTTFADQAVIAISNVRLFEEVKARTAELTEALQQQTATADVLKVISRSTFDLDTVLRTLVTSAAKLCGANYGGIYLRDGGHLFGRAAVGHTDEDLRELTAVPVVIDRKSIAGRVALSGQAEHIPDILEDSEWDLARLGKFGSFRSLMGIPLLKEGSVAGVFFLGKPDPGAFSPRQAELVQTFADQAVIAIENVRLFEEVQARTRELQESLEYQTATSEILNVISRSPTNLQPVMDVVAENAARVCAATDAQIFRVDSGVQRLVAHHGPLDTSGDGAPLVRGTVTGRAVVDRRSIHVADLAAELETEFPDAKPYQHKIGHRTTLATPLLREGVPLGAILIRRMEVRPFSEKQIALLETFADQAVIAIENVRLFEEVQARTAELTESLQQQTATAEVLKIISRSTFDLDAVLATLIESAARLAGVHRGVIYLRDGEVLKARAQYNTPQAFLDFLKSTEIRANFKVFPGRAFLTGEVVQIPDTEDTDLLLGESPSVGSFRAVLAVPMLRDGRVEGVFTFANPQPGTFSQRQIELVQTFADQAVIAIENVRLFDEVQARTRDLSEALQQQTATADVLKVISRSVFDLDSVLETLIKSAVDLCRANMGGIFLPSGQFFCLAAQVGMPRELVDYELRNPFAPERGTTTGRAVLTRSVVHIPDVLADPDYTYRDGQKFGDYRAMLGVPLIRDDEVIGVFSVGRRAPGPFAAREIELVQTFADQAVMAIGNVRLFEEVQQRTAELGRSVGELKALGEVSQAVNSTLDLKTVLETIVAKAVHLSGTDAGAIYVFNQATEKFRLRATDGMSAELIDAISSQTIGLNDAGIGEAARLRTPVQMSDLAEGVGTPLQRIVFEAGYRSLLVVPLLRPNKIVGALVVRRKTPGLFEPSTIQLMETFAAQSVLAIQNARLFSEIEEKGRQLEVASRHKSQFLANMSHELRTPLNSVLGFSEMLADGLYGELPDKAVATLARIQANGKHLLGLINDVLDLSKIEAGQLELVIDSYSPGQIVRTVAGATEPLARAKKLELRCDIADSLPFGRGDERRLTQVLINLAGNAVKFTDAGSVEISAAIHGDAFEFAVRDTGPGIAPEHQQRIFEEFHQVDDSSTRLKGGTGLGLAISKRIVEMHGGRIGLTSAPGEGSTFRVTIPVMAVARTEAA